MGFWGVIAIAMGIAAIALVRGTFTVSLGLALVVLMIGGAVFPPAGLLIGGAALFYLVFVHGPELFSRLGSAIGGSK